MWLPNVNETPELFTCGIWFFKQAIKPDLSGETYFLDDFHIAESGDTFSRNKSFVEYG